MRDWNQHQINQRHCSAASAAAAIPPADHQVSSCSRVSTPRSFVSPPGKNRKKDPASQSFVRPSLLNLYLSNMYYFVNISAYIYIIPPLIQTWVSISRCAGFIFKPTDSAIGKICLSSKPKNIHRIIRTLFQTKGHCVNFVRRSFLE